VRETKKEEKKESYLPTKSDLLAKTRAGLFNSSGL
jgi:hypothetical protein